MKEEVRSLLEAASAAGALEAEVFWKAGRGRKVVLEPGHRPGAPPIRTVSHSEEEGVALRLIDRDGHLGFAWIGQPGAGRSGASLVQAALASARHDPGPHAPGARQPEADAPRARAGDVRGPGHRPLGPGPRAAAGRRELRLAHPECMTLPEDRIAAFLLDAVAEAGGASGSAGIDRLTLSEAVMTIEIANTRGFSGRFTKSLAFLGVALLPEEPGAAAVIEERSACRLSDLDPGECLREALLRARPARQTVEAAAVGVPAGATVPLFLTPRASASLLAALLPRVISGEPGDWKGSALRIVDDPTLAWRPGSAPFDGAGFETRMTVLIEDGAAVGRLSAEGGNLVRPSYRDLPEIGPAGLLILPPDRPPDAEEGLSEGSCATPVILVSAVDIAPGPVWILRLRRADWRVGGTVLGPADGLLWEGPPGALLKGVSAAGTEVRFYHCGVPIGTPGLRIEGLAPLRAGAPGRSALSV